MLPDNSVLKGQKIGGKCQNSNLQMRHFSSFSNNVKGLGLVRLDFLYRLPYIHDY